MPYTVEAVGICKSFGGHKVLNHVDLAIRTGSVFALLGANGAGKSTMVRVLATLVRPDAGFATIAGHDLRADPMGVRASISLTGQHVAIDDVLTGRENLEMMGRLLRLSPAKSRARATDLLVEFDMVEAGDRRVKTYSGGMKRRLDLAISMIERPQLMFLDEPTTGLDPRSREQLWATVRRIVADGVTVLLTTQYLEEADQLADTIAMLDRGEIVASGTPEELKATLGGEVVRLQFADESDFERALACLLVERAHEHIRAVDVATEGSAAEVYDLLARLESAGTPAARVSTYRPTLDDVFLSLTATSRVEAGL